MYCVLHIVFVLLCVDIVCISLRGSSLQGGVEM